MFTLRLILIAITTGCASVDQRSYGDIIFDNSFDSQNKFILQTCLTNSEDNLYLSNLSFLSLSENINSIGLEFNSKISMTIDYKSNLQDEKTTFRTDLESETNYISSNMAANQQQEIIEEMLLKFCNYLSNTRPND
ncbi:MAG: hypothetical protein CMD89_02535 [Gammaproteobacteria bacterium]|nr:hypothetical protein [Gammaproteobacteria bacterium]